jgi:antitoxin CptB
MGSSHGKDGDLGQLRWRCRRGMKELDVLLTRYLDEQYGAAAPDLKRAFRQLLEVHDPLLYDYFLGRASPPDAGLSSLIESMTAKRSNES